MVSPASRRAEQGIQGTARKGFCFRGSTRRSYPPPATGRWTGPLPKRSSIDDDLAASGGDEAEPAMRSRPGSSRWIRGGQSALHGDDDSCAPKMTALDDRRLRSPHGSLGPRRHSLDHPNRAIRMQPPGFDHPDFRSPGLSIPGPSITPGTIERRRHCAFRSAASSMPAWPRRGDGGFSKASGIADRQNFFQTDEGALEALFSSTDPCSDNARRYRRGSQAGSCLRIPFDSPPRSSRRRRPRRKSRRRSLPG